MRVLQRIANHGKHVGQLFADCAMIRGLLPRSIGGLARRAYDWRYCKSLSGKETLGAAAEWTILTNGLTPDAVVYSGGVGGDMSFELELVNRFGVIVHLFDPSPIAVTTVMASRPDDRIVFSPVGLAAKLGGREFSVGGGTDDSAWFKSGNSGNGFDLPCTTIAEQMRIKGHDHIDLLKIDIEGFEYEVLDHCLTERISINQICVEFHHFFPEVPRSKTYGLIRRLRAAGYRPIHKRMCDWTFWHGDLGAGA